MIDCLHIQNFRCFQDFNIEKTENINLFLTVNSEGKTAFLESIFLLLGFDSSDTFTKLFPNVSLLEYIFYLKIRKKIRLQYHLK